MKMEEQDFENITPLTNIKLSDRHIKVNALGEVSLPPDRCKLTVRIQSQKENVEEVKSSIKRRVDYVIQTLHNNSLKVMEHVFVCVLLHFPLKFPTVTYSREFYKTHACSVQ